MGTSGITGFRLGRRDKISYNHSDSYPDFLGDQVVSEVAEMMKLGWNKVRHQVEEIRLYNEADTPTRKLIDRMKKLKMANFEVSTQSEDDFYCLLREAQGHPLTSLQIGAMVDSSLFVNDSLFCEWGYIINLDQMVLEVYKGYQKKKHRRGRYGRRKEGQGINWKPEYKGENQYFPIALIKTFPLDSIPENWKEQCEKVFSQ